MDEGKANAGCGCRTDSVIARATIVLGPRAAGLRPVGFTNEEVVLGILGEDPARPRASCCLPTPRSPCDQKGRREVAQTQPGEAGAKRAEWPCSGANGKSEAANARWAGGEAQRHGAVSGPAQGISRCGPRC